MMNNMDNPEEVAYQAIEEQYLNDSAKFKKGDVVYYKPYVDTTEMRIGIINEILLIRDYVTRNGKRIITRTIGYRIINPKGFVIVTEPRVCSASEYIFREYLKHKEQVE